jgi:hypothetical protein
MRTSVFCFLVLATLLWFGLVITVSVIGFQTFFSNPSIMGSQWSLSSAIITLSLPLLEILFWLCISGYTCIRRSCLTFISNTLINETPQQKDIHLLPSHGFQILALCLMTLFQMIGFADSILGTVITAQGLTIAPIEIILSWIFQVYNVFFFWSCTRMMKKLFIDYVKSSFVAHHPIVKQ